MLDRVAICVQCVYVIASDRIVVVFFDSGKFICKIFIKIRKFDEELIGKPIV